MDDDKKKKKSPKKKVTKKVVKEKQVEKKVEKKVETKEKPTYSTCQVLFVMLITLIFGLLLGRLIVKSKESDNKKKYREENEIDKVYNDIVDNYYGELNHDELVSSAICGMVSALNDQYSFCMDTQSGNTLLEELEGSFVGLGVVITDVGDNKVTILSVYSGSPAAIAGIQDGDVLLSMDGVELLGENIASIASEIKSSQIGTTKSFKVLRDNKELNIDVVLDEVEIPTIYSYIDERDNSKTGIIYLTGFSTTTYDQFVKEYEKLKEENINSLVVDVRNNTGGVLSAAVNISSLFLDKDMVVYQKSNGRETEKVLNEKDKVIDLPTVVVVNENTSSSAEVFAASLSENLNVPIVGINTYGKGTIQKFTALPSGVYVKYTIQEWLTPNGNKINGVGIAPDYEVSLPEGGSDTQLEKAFEVIGTMVNASE